MLDKMPAGGNYQLLNVMYAKPGPEIGWDKDHVVLVYRDEDTNEKRVQVIDDPKFTWHINREDTWLKTPVRAVQPQDVDAITSLYRDRFRDMAEELDLMAFYNEKRKSGNRYLWNQLHLNYNVHGTDTDIRDYFIAQFLDRYPYEGKLNKLTKGYYDIEVNQNDFDGTFPDEHYAPCPIDLITVFFDQDMTCHTFALVFEDNPQMMALDEDAFNAKTVERIRAETGDTITSEIHWHYDELEMIKAFFDLVDEKAPDYMLAWNAKFDLLTLINRINQLGARMSTDDIVRVLGITERQASGKDRITPADIMCSKRIPIQIPPYFKEDTRTQEHADKNEMFDCSSMAIWIDQLIAYAQLRKVSGKKDSYALNAIAEDELKAKKDVMPPGANIRNINLVDYEAFVSYNINDVILLYRLEKKNKDMEQLHNLGLMTQTRVQRAMAKTVCLKNFFSKFCKIQGWIMSNNRNQTYGKEGPPSDKFLGAFVADPNMNMPAGADMGNGRRSRYLFENVIDMDLSSLYPSIILACNIDVGTQMGKLLFDTYDHVAADGTRFTMETEESKERAASFCDSMASRDMAAIGNKYFGLPSVEDMVKEVALCL
jgi:DNA polymerase elongation subunit (family B)